MSRATPATRALDAADVEYRLHAYVYDPQASNIGLHAAQALGVEPARLLKTLMAKVDGRPACALLPVARELSLKKLAAALGGKQAELMTPAEAERLSGYHIGGISPLGQKKRLPVAIEAAALEHASVLLNGGQRGLQVELAPQALARLLDARVAGICAG
jgi:Cys-tRNA(Pro)/Cys-tRNA(Cys) deacylase